MRDKRKWAILLLGAACFIRLVVWAAGTAQPDRLLAPDSADYLRLAEGLADHGVYGSEANPEIFRVPGYPFFLSLLFVLGRSPAFICLIQVVVDVATCWLLWRLARDVLDLEAALPALFFQAFSVLAITYACRVLSESLFTFLFVVLLHFIWRSVRSPVPRNGRRSSAREQGSAEGDEAPEHSPGAVTSYHPDMGAVCGILLAAMVYVRAVALPFAILPPALLLGYKRRRGAAVCAALVLVLLAPWYLRNLNRAGYPHFSTVGAINLYRYNAAMVIARQEDGSFVAVQKAMDAKLGERRDQADRARFALERGRGIIMAHPLLYAGLHLKTVPTNLLPAAGELFRTLGVQIGRSGTLRVIRTEGILEGIRHYFGGKWGWFVAALPMLPVLLASYMLAVVGAFERLLRGEARAFHAFLILAVGLFLLVPGGAAHPRFRLPVTPIFSLYAGWGAWWLWHLWKNHRSALRPSRAES